MSCNWNKETQYRQTSFSRSSLCFIDTILYKLKVCGNLALSNEDLYFLAIKYFFDKGVCIVLIHIMQQYSVNITYIHWEARKFVWLDLLWCLLYRGSLKPNPQDLRLTFISYHLLGQESDPAVQELYHFQNCKNCLGKVINLNIFSYHNLKILEFIVCKKKKPRISFIL